MSARVHIKPQSFSLSGLTTAVSWGNPAVGKAFATLFQLKPGETITDIYIADDGIRAFFGYTSPQGATALSEATALSDEVNKNSAEGPSRIGGGDSQRN